MQRGGRASVEYCGGVGESTNNERDEHPMPGRRARLGFVALACTATAFGVAGVFLPLLPATPFLLLAVWAAPKGSQRVHGWIYAQPRLARLLDDWHQQGALPRGAKWLATAMMLASWSFLLWREYHWALILGMGLFFAAVGLFLWTRPKPRTRDPEQAGG